MPGWYQELQGHHVPETLEYNISSFVFRAQRPFHPMRLDRLLSSGFDGVIRSKGVIWVASYHAYGLTWGQAGTSMNIENGSLWLHGSEHPSRWPVDTPQEFRSSPYGDRRQELVFIGRNLNEAKVRQRLERALVTDAEFELGKDEWAKWQNPFGDEAIPAATPKKTNKSSTTKAAVQKKPSAGRKKVKPVAAKMKQKASSQVEMR